MKTNKELAPEEKIIYIYVDTKEVTVSVHGRIGDISFANQQGKEKIDKYYYSSIEMVSDTLSMMIGSSMAACQYHNNEDPWKNTPGKVARADIEVKAKLYKRVIIKT